MIDDNSWLLCEELTAIDGVIGCITLNRPQAFNALTHQMILKLDHQLRKWATQDNMQAVVLKSAHPRAFSAGGDIRALYENRQGDLTDSLAFFADEYRLNHLIGTYAKPIIALVDGVVMGGGAGLAMHCSHRVGTENILFAMPETAIGLFPDVGASYFLQKCPGLLAIYLGLVGARLHIADCCYARVIDYFVPSNQLSDVVQALCATELPGDARHAVGSVINTFSIEPDEAPLKAHQFTIDGVFAAETVSQIIRVLQNDDSQWSQVVAEHLQQKSPMSLSVSLEAIVRAKGHSLLECLQQDFNLAQSFLADHDFYEGIRAVIIDKDMQPKWQPACLSDIDSKAIDAYFSSNNKEVLKV